MSRRSPLVTVSLLAALGASLWGAGGAGATPRPPAPPAPAPAPPAVGPGALSHFDLARKDCLGTAANRGSKVWYTVADGVLSDVYSPTIDNTNVETLQYVVTDGRTFTDLQTRDTTATVRSTNRSGMACRVTSTAKSGSYALITDYITDPARDSVVMRTRLESKREDLKVYVRYDATVNGNGGGGPDNGGADSATVDPRTTALVSYDTSTESQAVNRDYAGPLYGALRADRPFRAVQSGFAGTPSDPLAQLETDRKLTGTRPAVADGNVVQVAELDLRSDTATLALGYGATLRAAVATSGASVGRSFAATEAAYLNGWRRYDARLADPPRRVAGLSRREASRAAEAYWLSVNVLKASEDKTFPGAVIASLGSPWGQAVSAGARVDGKPVYFGSYREVFARDLYESFTGFLAAGDVATARASTRFLFERQQLPDGRMPRNSLVNGKKAPDTGGDQLDETAFPILMVLQSGLAGDRALWRDHVKKAADFVVSRGPSFGAERWEEQGGYSPSTIAAEIAGLVAAGRIADIQGDTAAARVYRATADHFQRSIKGWTVTTTGPYATGRYFIRLSRNGDPNQAVSYNLGNGSIDADQRSVVDAGFLELTRLGALAPDDPDVLRSLAVVDETIRRTTATGTGWYRYGTAAAGTEDGYGDCWEPDPTNCSPSGKPWPTGNSGSGHTWPVLAGERGEHFLETGDAESAGELLRTMDAQSSGIGLIPEQTWENTDLPKSPFGTAPEVASIGFVNGGAAGSASPLTWAQGQQVRLLRSLAVGRPIEQPEQVRERYADGSVPAVPLTLTSPAEGAQIETATVTVAGTTSPGAQVDVSAIATDAGTAGTVVSATAGPDGAFGVEVPAALGANAITVAATLEGATGYARRTVISNLVTGTTVLDTTDPGNDDDGPGTYAYPTSGNFADGAFDLTRFQVIDGGDTIVLRTTLRDLTPTFGSALGAQMLDVYVREPGAAATSTAAASASRNYAIAAADAWAQRIQVQGFADPQWVSATGAPRGTLSVQASQTGRTITIVAPKARFGTPGPGWAFTVTLTGQDGSGPDQLRTWEPTPQEFRFGVCAAPGQPSPICAVDPNAVPKAMDVFTPAGVSQAEELDPTRGPVVLRAVPVG